MSDLVLTMLLGAVGAGLLALISKRRATNDEEVTEQGSRLSGAAPSRPAPSNEKSQRANAGPDQGVQMLNPTPTPGKAGPQRIHDPVREVCQNCGDELRTHDGKTIACPKCGPEATGFGEELAVVVLLSPSEQASLSRLTKQHPGMWLHDHARSLVTSLVATEKEANAS